jgi:hypothetical protein
MTYDVLISSLHSSNKIKYFILIHIVAETLIFAAEMSYVLKLVLGVPVENTEG